MVDVKSKILKIRNLPSDGKKLDQVNAKPYSFILLCLIIGICLLFTRLYWLGIFITSLFLYYLIFVKDIVLIEFYDYYAVFYLNNGKEECFLLFWVDVERWNLTSVRGDLDVLNIVLRNNESIVLKCLGKKKVQKYLHECIVEETDNEVTKQHA